MISLVRYLETECIFQRATYFMNLLQLILRFDHHKNPAIPAGAPGRHIELVKTPAVPPLKLSKGMIPILVRIPETRAPKKIPI